jgi:hypothetical protein
MANTTGGLPVETSDDTETTGALPGSSSINIGGQKISTKGAIAGPDLLKALQEEYARRMPDTGLGRFNTFMEGLKDAVAVTSRDPGSAMAAREQEKRLREESLFQMRAQMAALKGQMAQQQQMQNMFFGDKTAPAPATDGTAPAPATGGAAAVNAATNGLINAVEDPNLRQQIATQFVSDPAVAMKQLNTYLTERAKMPEVQKEVNYLVSLGYDKDKALGVALLKVAGSGAFVPHDVRTGQGTVQSSPFQTAGAAAGAPAAPAAVAKPVTPAAVPAPGGAPAAVTKPVVPTPAAPTGGAPAPAAVTKPVTPAPAVAAAPATPVQGPAALAQPAAATNPDELIKSLGLNPNSTEALAIRKKAAEDAIERETHRVNKGVDVAAEGESEASKLYGKEYANIPQHKQQAADTAAAADRVIKMADSPAYRKLMGYYNGGNPAASLLVGALNNLPGHIFDKERMESLMNSMIFTKDERSQLEKLKTDAAKLGIEYTANMFKGARLGIGLEKLGQTGKGVSTDYTPETNKLFAQITKNNARFVVDAHNTYRDQWLPQHPGKTWGDFVQSREYDSMLDSHLAKEQALAAGTPIKIEKLPASSADTAGTAASKFDKYKTKKQ